MYSRFDPEEKLNRRKKPYEAKAALLDLIEFLADSLTVPVRNKADKVYCYCNMKGSVVVFRVFYTEADKAYELKEAMDENTYDQIELEAIEQLERMRKFYSYCTDIMPSELLMDFDPVSRKVHAFKNENGFTSAYDAEIRFKAWFEEHGGKGKAIGPRIHDFESDLLWKFFKKGEEKAESPMADAKRINIYALNASREKVKKLEAESAKFMPLVSSNYLEGDTGFLAIKDAFDERYSDDKSPDYLYYQNVDDLRDDYKLFRKNYNYTMYEYIAVYEDAESWHIVSLGMSELGSKPDGFNKHFDAEYSMRIKKAWDEKLDDAESANAVNLVSILADEACNNKRMLKEYSCISLGHEDGMDYKRVSDKVAFIVVPDARISSVDGPFGTVHFRQAVPITRTEYKALKAKEIDVETLYEKIGTDLTDYDRPSVI